jgi:multidrug efflux pump subunit AcrB
MALTVLLYVVIPKGLFPTQDTGQLQGRIEASQDVSYTRMAELQQQAANAILADPDVASVSSVVGVDAANNTAEHRQHAHQPCAPTAATRKPRCSACASACVPWPASRCTCSPRRT